MAPGRKTMRAFLLAYAASFVILAAAERLGPTNSPSSLLEGTLASSCIALLAVALPVGYLARAAFAAVAGLLPLLFGVQHQGPLGAMGFEGVHHAEAGLVLVTALPGVLLFRARYRAFGVGRWLLAAALVVSAPALYVLATAAVGDHASVVARASDGTVIAASLLAFAGFMGAETSGACTVWAVLLLGAHAARLGLRASGASVQEQWQFLLGAVGEVVATTLVAFSVFQLLAVVFGRAARKVDVHQIVGPSAPEP